MLILGRAREGRAFDEAEEVEAGVKGMSLGKGKAPMTLIEQVAILKQQLGLEGNVKDVIDQAAEQVGVSTKGQSLPAIATACLSQLGY